MRATTSKGGRACGRPRLLLVLPFLFLQGCTTLLTQDYRIVDVDISKAQVTVTGQDGIRKVSSVPYEAVVKVDKLTGVSYQEASFCFEGLAGLEYVDGGMSLLLGHRLAYLGRFGFHDAVSVSADSQRQNGMGVGLDYRYDALVFGFNAEAPFSVITGQGSQGLRLGFFASAHY